MRALSVRVWLASGLALVAAGCGETPGASLAALRARVPEVDTLAFSAMTQVAANPPPDVKVTVSDATTVQAACSATLALPLMPSGTYNCPADFGVTYQLTFEGHGAPVMTAVLDPTGCQQVEVSDGTNAALLWTATAESYWATLATDLGVPVSSIFPYVPPAAPP